jgi:hypothetical protein
MARLNNGTSIMKVHLNLAIGAALLSLAALSAPAFAQGKTAKACREEWQAAKDDFKAKGVTEKAYVAQCHDGGSAAAPAATPAPAPATAAPASGKTASACRDEWRANKAANQAAHITEKAYVASCLNGTAVAAPSPPAPAPSAPPQAAPPTHTAAPTPPPPSSPPASTASRPSPPPYVAPAPSGVGQFAHEAQAKASCPSDTVVWVNNKSKIYHFAGYKNYGDTKNGAFMCERQAMTEGYRAAKNEKHPGA